jgi:hypothetical protein
LIRWVTKLAIAGLVVSACGSGGDVNLELVSSTESIGVGPQRVLLAMVDPTTGEFLAEPDSMLRGTLRNEDGSPLDQSLGQVLWVTPDVTAVYAFHFTIPEAETFQVTVDSEKFGELGPVGFIATEDPETIGAGDMAPHSRTRTTASHPLGEITTDPAPDPTFYELSVAEAIKSGPSVIVFSSFLGCAPERCGTLLDQVKSLSSAYSALHFVHVEVYEDVSADDVTDPLLVEATREWGLPSEPWVFVVDQGGVVRAAFEGVASDTDLSTAFSLVSP